MRTLGTKLASLKQDPNNKSEKLKHQKTIRKNTNKQSTLQKPEASLPINERKQHHC